MCVYCLYKSQPEFGVDYVHVCVLFTRLENPNSGGLEGQAPPRSCSLSVHVENNLVFGELSSSLMDPRLDLGDYGTGK